MLQFIYLKTKKACNKRLRLFMLPLLTLSIVGSMTKPSYPEGANEYEYLKIFYEILYLVQTNYIEPTKTSDLAFNAVKGMEEDVTKRGYKNIDLKLDWESVKDTDTESALKLFSKALYIFQKKTDVPPKELIDAAIKGMLKKLDSSSYHIPPDLYQALQAETQSDSKMLQLLDLARQ